MSICLTALGEAIREARVKKGWTQEATAEQLGIAPIHLKNIEGARRNPSVPMLFRLMELLDFSVDALVFPDRAETDILHIEGLSSQEKQALIYLVEAMRQSK